MLLCSYRNDTIKSYSNDPHKINYDQIFSKMNMLKISINYKELDNIFKILKSTYKEYKHINRMDLNSILIEYLKYLRTKNANINQIFKELFYAISNMAVRDNLCKCLIPISGIQVHNSINISRQIKIQPLKDRSKVLRSTDYYKFSALSLHNKLNYMYICLKSNGVYTARQQAYVISKAIIDSWITFFPGDIKNHSNVHIGNTYSDYGNELSIICNNEYYAKDQFSSYNQKNPLDLNKYLSPTNIIYGNINYIAKLQQDRLDRKKLSKLNACINNSNELIAKGRKSDIYSTKIIKFTAAIESLIKDKRSVTRPYIKQRVAKLICRTIYCKFNPKSNQKEHEEKEVYDKIRNDVNKLYDFRNDVAHGDFVNIPYKAVHDLSVLARMVISDTIILVEAHKVNNRQDLINFVK